MLKPYNLWLIFADFFIYPWRHWYMGHSQGGGGWGATCFTHHICQELLSTSKKPYLSQKRSHWNTQFPLSTINCGGMEKWVNHETYRLLTREAQPDRSCNPLSSDDIRPIIPMPGQVDLRSPFRCSEVFLSGSLWKCLFGVKRVLQLRVLRVGCLGEHGHPTITECAPCAKQFGGPAGSSKIYKMSKDSVRKLWVSLTNQLCVTLRLQLLRNSLKPSSYGNPVAPAEMSDVLCRSSSNWRKGLLL